MIVRTWAARATKAGADAIRAIAGDDITTAVVEPEALAVLQHSDPTVVHRDVLVHA